MDLINKDALKMTIDLFKKSSSFNQDALKSIQGLTDDEVLLLLYNDMNAMNKFKKGTYNGATEAIGPTVKSSPNEKVIISYLEYLIKKSNQSESFDKIPYLKSIEVFVAWLTDEVFVKAK
jgi:hypothetical protein